LLTEALGAPIQTAAAWQNESQHVTQSNTPWFLIG
jgi:hypothetical protein